MNYNAQSLADLWPNRFPKPDITEHENGIHVYAHPPSDAETPWQIEMKANSQSGYIMLDAFHTHEEGMDRIKLMSPPAPDGNRLQHAVNTITMLWESTLSELHG